MNFDNLKIENLDNQGEAQGSESDEIRKVQKQLAELSGEAVEGTFNYENNADAVNEQNVSLAKRFNDATKKLGVKAKKVFEALALSSTMLLSIFGSTESHGAESRITERPVANKSEGAEQNLEEINEKIERLDKKIARTTDKDDLDEYEDELAVLLKQKDKLTESAEINPSNTLDESTRRELREIEPEYNRLSNRLKYGKLTLEERAKFEKLGKKKSDLNKLLKTGSSKKTSDFKNRTPSGGGNIIRY